ncbi:flagellar motor switch protein FliN [Nocardioides marinus]|uniref:Flagellar motor switch protein FliN/FliY n=1 Tax=Nocardioides marinus TaxID=374514 RepID=A0A7Z0C227_9ACTN|nr:flagellar motor switch protein FliN [Nocardioides marinus]NYI08842.1 flagellar motor switch protein FliN/FliY [Nocardioides marinus]
MTAAPLVPGPHDAVATTAAEALAAVLPSSEQLLPGTPQPGTEHVTSLFSAAVVADLGGAISGRVGVLVADELTSALSSSPMGELDLAAAVQPALDAAAVALGGTAQPGRTVDLDDVVADMGGDFTAVPLMGTTIFAAVLVPDSTLQVAAAAPGASASAAAAPAAPAAPAPPAAAAAEAPSTLGEALGSVSQPALPPVPGPPVEGNVRSIATGRRGIEMLHGVEMEVTVELGRTRMAVRDLLALTPGAVLALDRAAGSPADLLVNGRLIARGEVVVVDEDFGLRITEILDQSAAV